MALDGVTFGVKAGVLGHRLDVSNVTTRFGAASPSAAQNPLDLRLRYIWVSEQPSQGIEPCHGWGHMSVAGYVAKELDPQPPNHQTLNGAELFCMPWP